MEGGRGMAAGLTANASRHPAGALKEPANVLEQGGQAVNHLVRGSLAGLLPALPSLHPLAAPSSLLFCAEATDEGGEW